MIPKSHSLIEAEEWAKNRGAELYLTHVAGMEFETLYWDTEGVGNVAVDQSQMYQQEQAQFEEMGEALNTEIKRLKEKGIVASGKVMRGDAAKEVLSEAKKVDADMIIVGCHRKEGYQGMVYKLIIEGADRPVLVIPTPE